MSEQPGANYTANHSSVGVMGINYGNVTVDNRRTTTIDQSGQKVGGDQYIAVRDMYITHAPPTDLPVAIPSPVPDFIGRDTDLDAIVSAMTVGNSAAIAGIRGMGGIGKSQLAYAVAHRLKEHYPKQMMLGLLGSTATPLAPTAALQRVIQIFRPDARDLPDDLASLKSHYHGCLTEHGQPVLLLADDAANAEQVRPLIPPDGCALLVTSRTHIELEGMQTHALGMLSPIESETLLRQICPRIGDDAPELAKLCDYLPLALRVSATFLKRRPTRLVAAYLQNLRDEQARLKHLHDPKDPTLNVEASLSLSYDALPTDIQQAFAQLGVFMGSFTLEAADTVVEVDSSTADDLLEELYLNSLLEFDEASTRYDLHDLVRAFALDRLPDERPTRLRYARYYVDLMATAQTEWYFNGKPLEALALFDRERHHFDAGWTWAQQQPSADDTDALLLDFPNAIYGFAAMRYNLRDERIPHLKKQRDAARRLSRPHDEISALINLGNAYHAIDEYAHSIEAHQQALNLARKRNDRRGEGMTLGNLGNTYISLGKYRQALEYLQPALTIAYEIGAPHLESSWLGNLGNTFTALGDYEQAIEYHERRLTIAQEIGNRRHEGEAHGNLGNAYAALGYHHRAIECHEQHLAIVREISDRRGEGAALGNLGNAFAALGDYQQAVEHHNQHLTLAREVGDRRGESNALGNLGIAHMNLGDAARAVEYYERALHIAREIGNREAEARHSWNLGQLYAAQDDPRAAKLLTIYRDFLREINHPRLNTLDVDVLQTTAGLNVGVMVTNYGTVNMDNRQQTMFNQSGQTVGGDQDNAGSDMTSDEKKDAEEPG
jgi:tetratricopeptide (TPR) repeat protein